LDENPEVEQATIQEVTLCNRLGEIAEDEIPHDEQRKTWALQRLVFMYWIFCGTYDAWEWDVERIQEECRRDQEGKKYYSGKLQPKSRGQE
jgi:hypothetical protein